VAELQPLRLALLRGEQERRRVGVAARPGHVDVSRAEPVAQRHQHAQLAVVPERGDVARLPGGLQVPGPPCGNETLRSTVGDLARPGGVQPGEDRDGVQKVVHAGAAVEPDGGQHRGHELPQVRHRGVHHRQVPVVAREPRPAGLPRGPHPPVADVRAQPAADLVVAHVRVEHDPQDVIEQGLPVLAGAGPLGQGPRHLRLRGGLPAGQRLVEQQQHLVQHVNRRLGDQGQQHRVPAPVVAPREVLGREPAPNPGQEPPPLSGQHRQVDRMGVHPAQERELFELVFHRGGRRRHRPGLEPGQARAPEHGIDS
jgi:hypothetical protein